MNRRQKKKKMILREPMMKDQMPLRKLKAQLDMAEYDFVQTV